MGFLSIPLFSEEWVDSLKHIPEAGMVARIEIYDPRLSEMVWDATENEYIETAGDPLYTGKARIQPLGSATRREMVDNDTSVQKVLFSIPIENKALALTTFHQVRVLDSALNPSLTKYVYVVSEFIDSSNPIEKTFYCTVNQELQ